MPYEKVDKVVQFYKMNTMFRLTEIIQIVTEQLESELVKNGIPARVAARVKKPGSLRDKLIKWDGDSKSKTRISSPEATLREVSDLAAVRVMTYTERDRPKVIDLVKKIFKSPEGIEGFDIEELENHPRIKENGENHYRATHMQICLLDNGLSKKEADTLTKDSCELQITSMLAHVWNEIEHDTIYKTKTGHLSTEEKRAINSLGLLTQTGDHIIQSLLSSRDIREKKEKFDMQTKNEIFHDKDDLSLFLVNHFGEKVGPDRMKFTVGNDDLLKVLHKIDWDHPKDIMTRFKPQILLEARKIAIRIHNAQKRADRTRSLYRSGTCDLFFVALCIIDLSEAEKAFECLHAKSRASILLRAFRELS